MSIEFVTKEDLRIFRMDLLNDIKALLSQNIQENDSPVQGLKTKGVRKILGCSVNKLMSLRVARKIRWKKIGGTVYYNAEDVKRLLQEGF